jgi:hypothetical protein
MRAVILAFGLALAAGPAFAADDPAPAGKDDNDKVVCKKVTKPNSRFATRTCMTKAEWEQQTEAAMKAFRDVQNRTQTFGGKGS